MPSHHFARTDGNHGADVGTGREGLRVSRDHDSPHVRIFGHAQKLVPQLKTKLRAQSVARLRTVQPKQHHVGFWMLFQDKRHERSSGIARFCGSAAGVSTVEF